MSDQKNYKFTIDGKPMKTMRFNVSDRFDKAKCQEELNMVMAKLKKQGYTNAQVTTIFDTNNRKNEFRSGAYINLKGEGAPTALLFNNTFPQTQQREAPKGKFNKLNKLNKNVFSSGKENTTAKVITKKIKEDDDDDDDDDDDNDYDDDDDDDDNDDEYSCSGGGGGGCGDGDDYLYGVNADVSGYSVQCY